MLAQVLELLLVRHAEALLLVDDDQPQVVGVHVARQQPVRADQHVDLAGRELLERALLLGGADEARQHAHRHAERLKALGEAGEVLLGEDGGGAQHHHLFPVLRRDEGRAYGDLGLAEAHVAADEAVHRVRRAHVGLHVRDGRGLVGRLVVGEALLHLLHPGGVDRELEAFGGGAPGVHLDQVERQLARRLARLRDGARPVGAVQARDLGGVPLRAHVARDLVELLDREEQLVAFRVVELEVVAFDAADVAQDEALEVRDAVRLVHHVVAGGIREGNVGGVDLALGLGRLARALQVLERQHDELRLGYHDAERHVDVHDVHDALLQRGRVGVDGVEALLDGQRMVDERQLDVLARAERRRAEQAVVAAVHPVAHLAEQPVLRARYVDALHRHLVVELDAQLHDGHVRRPHAVPEVHHRGRRVQALGVQVGALERLLGLLEGVRHVVEGGAGLHEAGHGAGPRVGAELRRFLVEVRQKHVGPVEAQAAFHLLERLAQRLVGKGRLLERLARTARGGLRHGQLACRVYVNGVQAGNHLPG